MHAEIKTNLQAIETQPFNGLLSFFSIPGIGDGDMEYADEVLQPFIKAFPKGAIFLYFAGRIRQIQGRLDEVINICYL